MQNTQKSSSSSDEEFWAFTILFAVLLTFLSFPISPPKSLYLMFFPFRRSSSSNASLTGVSVKISEYLPPTLVCFFSWACFRKWPNYCLTERSYDGPRARHLWRRNRAWSRWACRWAVWLKGPKMDPELGISGGGAEPGGRWAGEPQLGQDDPWPGRAQSQSWKMFGW